MTEVGMLTATIPCTMCRGVQPVINADNDAKATRGAVMNGHGSNGATGKAQQQGLLPTSSPGKLRYSKAAQKAAFAECRAVVGEHDSCVCQL